MLQEGRHEQPNNLEAAGSGGDNEGGQHPAKMGHQGVG